MDFLATTRILFTTHRLEALCPHLGGLSISWLFRPALACAKKKSKAKPRISKFFLIAVTSLSSSALCKSKTLKACDLWSKLFINSFNRGSPTLAVEAGLLLFFQIFSICLTSLKELSKHFKDVQKFALKLLKWQSMNGGALCKICHRLYLGKEPSFSAGLWETLCCSFSSVWPRLRYRGLQTSKTNKTQVWGWHLASLSTQYRFYWGEF